jgi:predicted MFS family arabinose efflux permease
LVSEYNPATRTTLNPAGELYGWGYWQVWLLLGIGSLLLVSFGVYELFFSADPVLDLRLFKNYNFALGNLVSWVSASAMFGVLALIPEFFQQAHTPNLSAVDTGLALIPLGVATIVGMVICRKFYVSVGPRPLVVAGSILMALSFWQLSQLTPTTSGGDIWPWLVLLGLSVSLTGITVTTLATERLNGTDLNKGQSLFQATKSIFGAVGPTILITILVQQTSVHARQLQEALVKTGQSGAADNPLDPKFIQAQHLLAAQAATSGMNDIFRILIFVAIGLTLIALALPGRNPHKDSIAPETTENPEVVMMS